MPSANCDDNTLNANKIPQFDNRKSYNLACIELSFGKLNPTQSGMTIH